MADSGRMEDSGQDGLLALVAQLSDKLAQQAATTAMWQTRAEVLATRLQQAEDTIRALEAPREAPADAHQTHTAGQETASPGGVVPESTPAPSAPWWRRLWESLLGAPG